MKRLLLGITTFAVLISMSTVASAQRNPRGKAALDLGGKKVSVEYGRPSLKGRTAEDMLSKLPVGGFWRLGADTSTTFTTSGDLAFGDTKVPAGTYSLWAQKESDTSWKLVFNSQHGQWGTEHDPGKDVVSAAMKSGRAADPPDQVTIALAKDKANGVIAIEWGNLRLSAEFN
ncbi:MAG TPA: DUF2911 domain-containing protein [Terriglobia bacterium]|nr:DUF2911 domain-containing protein [Terriglobia bacterium]